MHYDDYGYLSELAIHLPEGTTLEEICEDVDDNSYFATVRDSYYYR